MLVAGLGTVGQGAGLHPAVQGVGLPLDGDQGVSAAALPVTLRGARGSGPAFRGGFGERGGQCGGLAAVLVHAQGLVPQLRQPLAAHPLGPLEAVLAHERGAAALGPLAHGAAGRQRLAVVRQTDGGVHAAQEEEQVRGAVDAHQGPELVHLQAHLLLGVVVELVGHVGQVVDDALAHGHRDGLTHQVLGGCGGETRTTEEQQERKHEGPREHRAAWRVPPPHECHGEKQHSIKL